MCVARLALLLLLAPSRCGLVRIRSASAVGALGPHHLGGVFLVENLVAVAAFKCLLDHGGLLFRRGDAFRTRRRPRVLPSTWKSLAGFSGKCEKPDGRVLGTAPSWASSARKCHKGASLRACCAGGMGEFGVGDICDLRFCRRSAGLLVVGSRKRGPLAAFSDNSERFLCSEAPSWRFLTVVASLLSFSSALPFAGRQRCGLRFRVPSGESRSLDSKRPH